MSVVYMGVEVGGGGVCPKMVMGLFQEATEVAVVYGRLLRLCVIFVCVNLCVCVFFVSICVCVCVLKVFIYSGVWEGV